MIQPDTPQNIEAEKATLGSLLMNRDAIIAVAPFLTAEHFYAERHAWIYAAALDCYQHGTPPDTRTVYAALVKAGRADAAGGVVYLSDLLDSVPTSYHIEYYAREVVRCARLRKLISTGAQIAALGYNEPDADEAEGSAATMLADAITHDDDGGYVPIGETSHTVFQTLTSGIQPGRSTGFRDLDELTGGLHAGELTILAARPSVGKTAMALCMAANVAEAGGHVLINSLEMSRDQLLLRLIAMHSRIDLLRLRLNQLGDNQAILDSVVNAFSWADGLPIHVDDTPAATVQQIRAKAQQCRAAHGAIDLLVVDYLQLMSDTAKRKNSNRVEDVSAMSRGLKLLARELKCPVVALSQLSRAVEGRSSHVPMLSDLRDSGSLEQDADNVLFIYRDELYDKETDKKGVAELHISKQRQGPIGVVPLRFDAASTRFDTLSYRTEDGR